MRYYDRGMFTRSSAPVLTSLPIPIAVGEAQLTAGYPELEDWCHSRSALGLG